MDHQISPNNLWHENMTRMQSGWFAIIHASFPLWASGSHLTNKSYIPRSSLSYMWPLRPWAGNPTPSRQPSEEVPAFFLQCLLFYHPLWKRKQVTDQSTSQPTIHSTPLISQKKKGGGYTICYYPNTSHTHSEEYKEALIFLAHTIIHPGTVVIHLADAPLTNAAGGGIHRQKQRDTVIVITTDMTGHYQPHTILHSARI